MISVVVPVYNVEDYLRECMDSILKQSYADLEIILVDDGSKDSSGKICDDYARQDSRIRVIHQENQGLSGARNTGIEVSTGEYITFVDSDDIILPDMLEYLHNTCKEHDADLACARFSSLMEDGTLVEDPRTKSVQGVELYTDKAKIQAFLQHKRIPNSACMKLYERSFFDELRFPVGKTCEDAAIILRVIHRARRIAVTDKMGYLYRIRSCSIMSQGCSIRNYDILDVVLDDHEFITEHYPEFLKYMYRRIVNAAMNVTMRSALCKFSNPEYDKKLQDILRRFMKQYLQNSPRRNIIPRLAAYNLKLARVVIRLVYPIRPKMFSWN